MSSLTATSAGSAKRSDRERHCTHSMNEAFKTLKNSLPFIPPDTKIRTLRYAINYISHLRQELGRCGPRSVASRIRRRCDDALSHRSAIRQRSVSGLVRAAREFSRATSSRASLLIALVRARAVWLHRARARTYEPTLLFSQQLFFIFS